MTQSKTISGSLTRMGKKEFVQQNAQTIKNILADGYDSPEALVLEAILKTRYGYNKNANRKSLLSGFIRSYCQLNHPGHVVVGASPTYDPNSANMDETKYITNTEIAARMDLNDKRIMEFIEHKNHYMNKYPQNK